MKRFATLFLYLSVAASSAWMVVGEVRENLGYSVVSGPYQARVVRYDGLALTRSKRAIVEIRFSDGSHVTFGSRKTGRHEMFAVGESVRILKKEGEIPAYEIDYLPHRYGWSVLFSVLFFLSGSLVLIDLYRWRSPRRANQTPEPTPMSVTPPAAQEPRQP